MFAAVVEGKADLADVCVEAPGYRMPNGYAKRWFQGAQRLAHRVAWIRAHGPIPEGLAVLHRCDNPGCINVDHLFVGTHVDNMADKVTKGRQSRISQLQTHCRHGHEFTDENTRWTQRADGLTVRTCRACHRANERRRYHAGRKGS